MRERVRVFDLKEKVADVAFDGDGGGRQRDAVDALDEHLLLCGLQSKFGVNVV